MSMSSSAEAALRQAEAEELTLLRSESGSTGHKGVTWHKRPEAKPYKAEVRRGGTKVHLGQFATAEEAALCYARSPEAQAAVAVAAAAPAPPPMTAEEALRQAEAEGLTLLRSESSGSGYKSVYFNRKAKARPYHAQVKRGGKSVTLGNFATAEEAALVVARDAAAQLPAQATAPQPPSTSSMTSSRKRKVKSEEQPPDMPAGARVKVEEQPPPMPSDAHVKLEFEA